MKKNESIGKIACLFFSMHDDALLYDTVDKRYPTARCGNQDNVAHKLYLPVVIAIFSTRSVDISINSGSEVTSRSSAGLAV